MPSPKFQWNVKPAVVSTLLGSVAEPVKEIAIPPVPLYVPWALTVGATLFTVTTVLPELLRLSVSAALSKRDKSAPWTGPLRHHWIAGLAHLVK